MAVAATNTHYGTIELPKKAAPAVRTMGECSWLFYGTKKIGKTLLALQFPDALIFCFEPGAKGVACARIPDPNKKEPALDWARFAKYVQVLASENHGYATIIVDTADIAYNLCFAHVCKTNGVKHPQDAAEQGRGNKWKSAQIWQAIRNEFSAVFGQLLALPGVGKILISHSKESEVDMGGGLVMVKTIPTMSGQAHEFITGIVDGWFHLQFFGKERGLVVCGDERMGAGHRLPERFLVAGKKHEYVSLVPMGRTPQEAYSHLVAAFENKQSSADPLKDARKGFLSKRRDNGDDEGE